MPALGLALGLPFGRYGGGSAAYVPPLDAVTSKVLLAMSLRRLFTGNAEGIQVRESGGSTNADIGTLATGDFDATSFTTHIGAGNGFCRTAYDQKGVRYYSNTTAANQPQVTLNAIGTRAGLTWDSTDTLAASSIGTAIGTGDFEIWIVAKPTTLAGYKGMFLLGGIIYFYTSRAGNGKAGAYIQSSGDRDFNLAVSINTAHLMRLYRHSGVIYCDVDGTTAPNSWASTDNILASGGAHQWSCPGGEQFVGVMPEAILINGALTSGERDALKSNIATYYGLNVA